MSYNLIQVLVLLVLTSVLVLRCSDLTRTIMLIPVIILISIVGYFNGSSGYSIFFIIISMNFIFMLFSLIMTTENRVDTKPIKIKKSLGNFVVFLLCLFCGYFISDMIFRVLGELPAGQQNDITQSVVTKSNIFPLFLIVATMSFIVLYFLKAYRGDK